VTSLVLVSSCWALGNPFTVEHLDHHFPERAVAAGKRTARPSWFGTSIGIASAFGSGTAASAHTWPSDKRS